MSLTTHEQIWGGWPRASSELGGGVATTVGGGERSGQRLGMVAPILDSLDGDELELMARPTIEAAPW
jgi:hypothetical protein